MEIVDYFFYLDQMVYFLSPLAFDSDFDYTVVDSVDYTADFDSDYILNSHCHCYNFVFYYLDYNHFFVEVIFLDIGYYYDYFYFKKIDYFDADYLLYSYFFD